MDRLTGSVLVNFRGQIVKLSGKSEELHGGIFWQGVYITGPQEGQSVDVADQLIKWQQKGVKK